MKFSINRIKSESSKSWLCFLSEVRKWTHGLVLYYSTIYFYLHSRQHYCKIKLYNHQCLRIPQTFRAQFLLMTIQLKWLNFKIWSQFRFSSSWNYHLYDNPTSLSSSSKRFFNKRPTSCWDWCTYEIFFFHKIKKWSFWLLISELT